MNPSNMEKSDSLLSSALDLVTFFDIFKDDMKEEIVYMATDLERSVDENDYVEIIHTGSGFEQLSLPHLENYGVWNTDADHMIIRTDFEVREACEVIVEGTQAEADDKYSKQADATAPDNRPVNGIANIKLQDKRIENVNRKAETIEENEREKSDKLAGNGNVKADKLLQNQAAKPQAETAEGNANQVTHVTDVTDVNNNIVLYVYDGSHSGYAFISNEILQHPRDSESIKKHCKVNSEFVEASRKLIPLSRRIVMVPESGKITGPSYSLSTGGGSFNMNRDFVYGLKCTFWPLQAQEWISRKRIHGWPSKKLISDSVSQGCHVVPVGSHNSSLKEFEWRFSFSVVELKLAHTLTDNQRLAFSILKAVIKNEMKQRKIEVFASYHLKTTLFWFLEQRDWKTWDNQSLGRNILEHLEFFIPFYENGALPNYFIPDNNMIDHRLPEEMAGACAVLADIKSDFSSSLCRYIEANQALPVFFDMPITRLLKENSQKFLQVCKYNYLVMALAYILYWIKRGQHPVDKPAADDMVCKLLHKASIEPNTPNSAADQGNLPVKVPSTTSVLTMIEESIEADKLKVTESSAVILAVFNLVLTFHPTSLDKIGHSINSLEFQNHLTNPAFMECLLWAGRLHEKHCEVIYEFVVKEWISGPKFYTTDEEAEKLMKLLMVILGKPTKQASAVTGSLLRRNIESERFLLLRILAEFLLHVNLECSYIAFQACAYLMDKPVLSEIYNFVSWSSHRTKLRAVELILCKEELQAQLSEKEFDELVQMQYDLTQQVSPAS